MADHEVVHKLRRRPFGVHVPAKENSRERRCDIGNGTSKAQLVRQGRYAFEGKCFFQTTLESVVSVTPVGSRIDLANQPTRSFFTPSVVLVSSYGLGVMPSNEGRTLDSRVTFSGSFPSSFLAISFSNSTSRSVFEANCARCRNGVRHRGKGLVDTLGRHVVVVGADGCVLEVVKEAIEAGLLTRPRVEAARSGLEVRSIMTRMFWFKFDRWSSPDLGCKQEIGFCMFTKSRQDLEHVRVGNSSLISIRRSREIS